ncbi:tail fiber protein [Serratia sp. 121840015-1]
MPAGTITLKNNSAAVTGSGTAFSTELKANDFIVVTVGQTVYTLGVKSVQSNTALTLVRNFDGPSAGGLAWTPIPYGAMVTITAQTHAYTAEALRGLLLDKKNWQQVFSGTGDVTIALPDNSTYTGPAWNALSERLTNVNDKLAGKADLIDVPFGAISIWPLATPPSGFAICDGRSFDKNAQPRLAKLFPTGKLPDFRGVFPRGFDADRGLNKGQGLLQYAADRLKRHKHMPSAAFIREMGAGASFTGEKQVFPIIGKSFASASYYNWGSNFDGSWPYMHSTFNNEPADETAPKSIAVNFIIRFA